MSKDITMPSDYLRVLLDDKDISDEYWSDGNEMLCDVPIVRADIVFFPYVYVGVPVINKRLIELVKEFYEKKKYIGVVATSDNEDQYSVGTISRIIKVVENSDDILHVMLQGIVRFEVISYKNTEKTLADIHVLRESIDIESDQYRAVLQVVKDSVVKLVDSLQSFPKEVKNFIISNDNCDLISYLITSSLNIPNKTKQKVLEAKTFIQRGELLAKIIAKEVRIAEIKDKMLKKAQSSISKAQEEYLLKQQLKACSEELGTADCNISEINKLRANGKKKKWSTHTANFFNKILDKAGRTTQNNTDYSIFINQAELMLDLPWSVTNSDPIDIGTASKVLDKFHYKMDRVKDRILEFLSVLKLKNNKVKGQILCLVGPPGVGKTSLCRSIAKALGRDYVKIALGGVHDEAEIRGHRKTYVGAMSGRIIKGLQGLKSSNPVMVLDEIDKVSCTYGDPASALLEVLDPDQNNAFVDNYLETPYDLSKVFFIATANDVGSIPGPLVDRLEIVEVSGYAIEEKCEIADKYIVPEQKLENGIRDNQINIPRESIVKIIEDYTRESGVRELKRQIAAIMRKTARQIVEKKKHDKIVDIPKVEEFLGIRKYDKDIAQHITVPGVAIGLAWTPVGGDILFIESSLMLGKGGITLSGKLGDVMKESAMIALTYLKSHAQEFDIDSRIFDNYDVHIHVPDGATPKDGPSAGITLFTTLLSLYTQRQVNDNLAMTGELTLRGKVLPVGGIREKVLAAKRSGIKHVIMCEGNRKEVDEIDKEYIPDIEFKYIQHVNEIPSLAISDKKIENAMTFILDRKTNDTCIH